MSSPTSFTTEIRRVRKRVSTLPLPPQVAPLRGAMLELIDAMLLEADDEFFEQPDTNILPQGMPNFIATPTASQISQTMEPVVMVPAGKAPIAERPSIVAMPPGSRPHVEMNQVIDPNNMINPAPIAPTMIIGPGGSTGNMLPTTGEVRMVKPGADPIDAMLNPQLTEPVAAT